MNILIVMIPLSIVLLIGAGIAFFWAVENDQFEDLDTPGLLPLLDNPPTSGEQHGKHYGKMHEETHVESHE